MLSGKAGERLFSKFRLSLQTLRELVGNSSGSEGGCRHLSELITAIEHQSELLSRCLDNLTRAIVEGSKPIRQLVAGSENQAQLLNQQRLELVAGLDNQSNLLNVKLDKLIEVTASSNTTQIKSGITDAGAAKQLADQCISALEDEALRAAFLDRIVAGLVPLQHARAFWGDRLLTLDKSAGFLSEPDFAAAYGQIRGSHVYDPYQSPHTISWRLNTLVWAARNGIALDGDFVECGVFKGDFSWVVMELTQFASRNKQFFLYDTFDGFSSSYSSSEDFPDNPAFFDFADQVYKDPNIYAQVLRKFGDLPNVHIVRGVLPDTLTKVAPTKIAFMHIDLNSPAAEIGVLERLFDRVVSGGMIVFDDYGWYQYRRQKEAEDEFMAARGHRILELPTGQGLLVKR